FEQRYCCMSQAVKGQVATALPPRTTASPMRFTVGRLFPESGLREQIRELVAQMPAFALCLHNSESAWMHRRMRIIARRQRLQAPSQWSCDGDNHSFASFARHEANLFPH